MIRSIKNIDVRGKKVILRVDFNVPVEKGKVEDDFRIKRTLPTIKFLKKKGARIILISHVTDGRTKSLKPMAQYLKVKFLPDKKIDLIKKKIDKIKNGEVVLLENIRNYPGEEKNDKKFTKKLAQCGDIYINDAFSVSHREHASVVGITKYLPSYAGLLFEEELKNLSSAFKPKHPFLLILGGIKFKTKLGVLEKFLKTADQIFIGGALANNFFKAQGVNIDNSVFDPEVNIKKYLRNPKIILPIDLKTKNGTILDAGAGTINNLAKIIKESKFVLWNGPLGDFEKKGFEKGTQKLAKLIANSNTQSIIGGGDTVAAVRKFGIPLGKFSFVSTAGGALLEFLAKGTLPGIEALEKRG
jgi:phosphoglycerate kinase